MAINGISSSSFFPPNFLLQMQTPPHDQEEHPPQTSHFTPFLSSNPQDFNGVSAMLGGKRSMSISGVEQPCDREMNGDDDLSDDCSHGGGGGGGEKKRRLSMEQVRALEMNFELGNKLDPERKIQLARALGLQPRQIAIWFQNRRARWKTKQLEKDYELLKLRFEAVKGENDGLKDHNKKLQAEVLALKGREVSELINLNKETDGSSSNRSENSSEINLDISRASAATESPQYHHHPHQSIPFFPSLRPPPPPPSMAHILQASSRPEPKAHNGVHQDENFSNLLCGMEDQTAFWPWSDHNGFH